MVALSGGRRAAEKGKAALTRRVELTWRRPSVAWWKRWSTLSVVLALVITACSAGVHWAVLGLLAGGQDGDDGELGPGRSAAPEPGHPTAGRKSNPEGKGDEL